MKREEAKAVLYEWQKSMVGHGVPIDTSKVQALRVAIEALSAEAVQGWIPCSERLPDEKDCPMDCLVTRYSEQIGAYVDVAVCERDGTWTHEDWDAVVLGDVESVRRSAERIEEKGEDYERWKLQLRILSGRRRICRGDA